MYINNVFKVDTSKCEDLSNRLSYITNKNNNLHCISHFNLCDKYEAKGQAVVNTDTQYKFCYEKLSYIYLARDVVNLLGYDVKEIIEHGLRPYITEVRVIDNKQIINISVDMLPYFMPSRSRQLNRFEADYLIRKKDGNMIWISDVAYPWLDKRGKLIGINGCLRDITSRVNAENFHKQELLKQAYTDSLTDLANRRYFFEHLNIEMKRRQRNPRNLSILLIDLDHFKQINDKYGHYVGDQILQIVAEKIRCCTRETDLAARLGGEEFGLYLPDTPSEGAYEVAQRLRTLINEASIKLVEHNISISCTVSIGIASTSTNTSMTVNELYKLADKRLYIAKATGRNKVTAEDSLYYVN